MAKKQRFFVGNSDFRTIRETNSYWVDKSLFIRDFMDSSTAAALITRPRRFGKTTNLSMLRYFFDCREKNNTALFEGTKLFEEEPEYRDLCGKNPVIFLTFKDLKPSSWEDAQFRLGILFSGLFTQFIDLLQEDLLFEHEKAFFNDVLNGNAHIIKLENILPILSSWLYRKYKQKIVLLIDEYDTPIHSGFFKKFYTEIITFMRGFFGSILKDNVHLHRACITGILRVSRESLFSGLNNLTVYTSFSERFADSFGFTEDELLQIIEKQEVKTPFELIKLWYDGYQIGKVSDIYNPWSIVSYVNEINDGLIPYWVNSASDELLREYINEEHSEHYRADLLKLIEGKSIEKEIYEKFVFLDFHQNPDLLWTLLFFSGYLTFDKKIDSTTYSLRIPNFEVKFVYENIILDWFNRKLKISESILKSCFKSLINNQLDDFEKSLQKIVGDTFSYYDTAKTPEKVYQAYFLGLTAVLNNDYIIKSNRESGEGRYDILLMPKDKKNLGIVMEIKQLEIIENENWEANNKRINNKIKSARKQMQKNHYRKELEAAEVPQILELPVIFAGKVPYVKEIKVK
jgi:hypothetical protein